MVHHRPLALVNFLTMPVMYTFLLLIVACCSHSALAWSFFGGPSRGPGPTPLTHTYTASTWRHKRSINNRDLWRASHENPEPPPPWSVYVALLVAYSPFLPRSTAANQTDSVAIPTLLDSDAGTVFVSSVCPLARDATDTDTGNGTRTKGKRRDDTQLIERELLRSIREYAQGKGPTKY